ncbi:MAG: thiamine pyrophosphate-binding protein [Candidatus Odinarchaeota archaeon]|nr:thiamine pyrophosphate-binding protein [Candidatus Odinarchaeota archaeon]
MCFSLPGGHIAPIHEGLIEEGIEIISMRHKQAAGNAADGWGSVTRTPGVCFVTAGPGIANLVPALAQAYYANIPLIGITGRTAFAFLRQTRFPRSR